MASFVMYYLLYNYMFVFLCLFVDVCGCFVYFMTWCSLVFNMVHEITGALENWSVLPKPLTSFYSTTSSPHRHSIPAYHCVSISHTSSLHRRITAASTAHHIITARASVIRHLTTNHRIGTAHKHQPTTRINIATISARIQCPRVFHFDTTFLQLIRLEARPWYFTGRRPVTVTVTRITWTSCSLGSESLGSSPHDGDDVNANQNSE